MTRFHRETVSCPHCLNEEEVIIWDLIDVSQDPDLEDKLLLKELQNFECQNCNHLYILERPLLYLNPQKKTAIYYAPTLQEIADAVRVNGRLAPDLAAQLPLDFGLDFSTYHLRLVSSYNALIEKVHLLQDGLSDRLMEVVKLAVKTRLAEENIDLTDEAKAAALHSGTTSEILYLGSDPAEGENEDAGISAGIGSGAREGAPKQLLFQTYSVGNGWQQLELAPQVSGNTAAILLPSLPAEDRWDIVDEKTAESMISSLS